MEKLNESESATVADVKARIIAQLNEHKQKQIFVGIAGIPGSGKSTLSLELFNHFGKEICQIIPMDGYHIYRKELSAEQATRRGAPDTFDKVKFQQDLKNLQVKKSGSFPSFDHAEKDPVENSIQVKDTTQIILIEGLYLFLKDWNLLNLFDLKIFLKCNQDEADKRVALRHLHANICKDMESALAQAKNNDRVNAQFILDQSVIDEETIELDTSSKQSKEGLL